MTAGSLNIDILFWSIQKISGFVNGTEVTRVGTMFDLKCVALVP